VLLLAPFADGGAVIVDPPGPALTGFAPWFWLSAVQGTEESAPVAGGSPIAAEPKEIVASPTKKTVLNNFICVPLSCLYTFGNLVTYTLATAVPKIGFFCRVKSLVYPL
jgi:hypothetical protein